MYQKLAQGTALINYDLFQQTKIDFAQQLQICINLPKPGSSPRP